MRSCRRAYPRWLMIPRLLVRPALLNHALGRTAGGDPVGGHDLLALPDAVGERELADLQKVARQQPEAGRGTRLAIPADRPFAGTEAHRIEQHAAGIGWQLLARPLGNQAPKNRRRGAAVGPFRAGLADDG